MKINTKIAIFLATAGISNLTLTGCTGGTVTPSSSGTTSAVSSTPVAVETSSSSVASSMAMSSIVMSSSSAAVVPTAKLVYAVNAGSTSGATLDGVMYNADRFYTGGTANATQDPIAGVTEDALYQFERYGTFNYEIPVSNSTYSVVLHLVEMYQTTAGKRSFNVLVEGKQELTDLDLYSQVGHDGAFEYVVENVVVNDGKLSVGLNSVIDNATISGIAIYSSSGGEFIEPPDLTPVASEFDKVFLDVSCTSNTSPNLATGATCLHSPNTQRITKNIKIGGDSTKHYNVSLRVRGIFEPTDVLGGQKPLAGEPYTVGGNVNPATGVVDYQQYWIDVANPKQTYWLNNYGKIGHDIYKEDYNITITVAGGSNVSINMNDGNDRMIANFPKVIFSDLPPYNQNPTLGQLLRLDVINVEFAP